MIELLVSVDLAKLVEELVRRSDDFMQDADDDDSDGNRSAYRWFDNDAFRRVFYESAEASLMVVPRK